MFPSLDALMRKQQSIQDCSRGLGAPTAQLQRAKLGTQPAGSGMKSPVVAHIRDEGSHMHTMWLS